MECSVQEGQRSPRKAVSCCIELQVFWAKAESGGGVLEAGVIRVLSEVLLLFSPTQSGSQDFKELFQCWCCPHAERNSGPCKNTGCIHTVRSLYFSPSGLVS